MVRFLIRCTNLLTATAGDIVHTSLLNMDIVVLNSEEVANELLEGRSRIYSDRPYMATTELCVLFVFIKCILINCFLYSFGWEWTTTLARYGAMFNTHRRIFHEVLRSEAALTYRPKQLKKSYEMLTFLLLDPANYSRHFEASVLICCSLISFELYYKIAFRHRS